MLIGKLIVRSSELRMRRRASTMQLNLVRVAARARRQAGRHRIGPDPGWNSGGGGGAQLCARVAELELDY